jgi:hypothetical protein
MGAREQLGGTYTRSFSSLPAAPHSARQPPEQPFTVVAQSMSAMMPGRRASGCIPTGACVQFIDDG